jgi:hypothetical protein
VWAVIVFRKRIGPLVFMKMLVAKRDKVSKGRMILFNEEHNHLHRTYKIVKEMTSFVL